MKWRDIYSVNNALMDQQHQKLFDIINELETNIFDEVALEQLIKTLEDLSKYAWEHFKEEEKILVELNMPHLEEHKEEHHLFKKKIMSITQSFINGKEASQVADIHSFLTHWLENHILTVDMKYKV